MKLLLAFSGNGKTAIGWKIAAENLEEQKQLGVVRDLHFYGCYDQAMKYAGITTEKVKVDGKEREAVCTLGFKQEKFNNYDALAASVRYEGLDPVSVELDKGMLTTMYLVAETIERVLCRAGWESEFPVLKKIYEYDGSPGKWDLAIEITTKFQELNKDRDWDGEYMEEVDTFTLTKLRG